ncbi:hypothetical protein [Cognaticolwellia aestuarii]|nr:hypothetical protein [Cognaticolwellia aestuarii]
MKALLKSYPKKHSKNLGQTETSNFAAKVISRTLEIYSATLLNK